MARSKMELGKPAARVLIVDDHPAIREALALRIASQPDLEVCGEAADMIEALRVAEATTPDVAVIDIGLKSGNGIDLIQRLLARHENLRTIVWSMYSEDLYAERALRAGALGYVNKERATTEILDAIRTVLAGKVYLSPALTEKFLKQFVGQGTGSSGSPLDALSDRELDVFRLIGLGRKTQEIADHLHLSVKTIETYRDRIRQKLGLSDGAELTRCALQWTVSEDRRLKIED
jgi:DNA-binding NarL/FixJ family response regulator